MYTQPEYKRADEVRSKGKLKGKSKNVIKERKWIMGMKWSEKTMLMRKWSEIGTKSTNFTCVTQTFPHLFIFFHANEMNNYSCVLIHTMCINVHLVHINKVGWFEKNNIDELIYWNRRFYWNSTNIWKMEALSFSLRFKSFSACW